MTTQPSSSTVAAEADEQVVVRDEARRHEQRVARDDAAVVHLDAAQPVVVDDQLASTAPSTTPMARATSCVALVGGEGAGAG